MSNKIKFKQDAIFIDILIIIGCIFIATFLGWLFRFLLFPETNIVVVYILFVIIIARFTNGYIYGIIASILATSTFNYFFTEPFYTFSVDDPSYFITFLIMTLTSVITSALTSKVKQKVNEAQEKEIEANNLYRLTNKLTDASDSEEIALIMIKAISDSTNCKAAYIEFDESGEPERNYIQLNDENNYVRIDLVDHETIKYRMINLRTAYDIGSDFHDWPIYGKDNVLGVLRIPKNNAETMNDSQKRLIRAVIENTALALDRFRSNIEQAKSREAVIQERYRSNLLRAISHDLRTPLSGIIGTSEMIMGMTKEDEASYTLASDIHKDAEWLHSLVENILSLTRIKEGKLILNKQMETVEEVISVAVAAIEKRMVGRYIEVDIPEKIMFVPMDAKLIEQVLVNLLDNAVKHTEIHENISIIVKHDEVNHCARFTIKDCGRGIKEQDLPHVFQMFYTTQGQNVDSQRGVGLGLTICESIVKAHGGTIEAYNRKDGHGAEIVFTLPMEVN